MPDEFKWTSSWWAVALRVFLGALWIYHASMKLNPTFGGIQGIIRAMAQGNASHPNGNPIVPFKLFLLNVVLPHWQIFGVLIVTGEMLVGLSLFFGISARLGALIGIFLQVQYWMGRGYLEWLFTYPAIIVPHVVIIWTAAGRTLGVDRWLSRWKPRWPIW
jgi:uncharacterized membrane protein YphA (DoxX/SURF4 family)